MPKTARTVIPELLDILPDNIRTWTLAEAWVRVVHDPPEAISRCPPEVTHDEPQPRLGLGLDQLAAVVSATATVASRLGAEEDVVSHCCSALGTLAVAALLDGGGNARDGNHRKSGAADEAAQQVAVLMRRFPSRLAVQEAGATSLLKICAAAAAKAVTASNATSADGAVGVEAATVEAIRAAAAAAPLSLRLCGLLPRLLARVDALSAATSATAAAVTATSNPPEVDAAADPEDALDAAVSKVMRERAVASLCDIWRADEYSSWGKGKATEARCIERLLRSVARRAADLGATIIGTGGLEAAVAWLKWGSPHLWPDTRRRSTGDGFAMLSTTRSGTSRRTLSPRRGAAVSSSSASAVAPSWEILEYQLRQLEHRLILLGLLFGAPMLEVQMLVGSLQQALLDEEEGADHDAAGEAMPGLQALIDLEAFDLTRHEDARELCRKLSDNSAKPWEERLVQLSRTALGGGRGGGAVAAEA